MKRILLTSFAFILCVFAVCGCDKKENNDINNTNKDSNISGLGPFTLTSGDIADNMVTNSIKLSDTKFIVESNKTTYSTNLTNVSDSVVAIKDIETIVKDSSGSTLVTFTSHIDGLAAGETKTVQSSIDFELKDYATIEYKIVNK